LIKFKTKFVLAIWIGSMSVVQFCAAQSHIVLRDLTLIRNKTVTEYDLKGVTLSDGSKLGWDRILKADVGTERQSDFDAMIKQVGLPIFRLKSRIAIGDWAGAGEMAAQLSDRFEELDRQNQYLISLTRMKLSEMRPGNKNALAYFLKANQLQPQANQQTLKLVGMHRLSESETKLQFSNQILPVWFSTDSLSDLADEIVPFVDDRPGALIYLASIRIELEQFRVARPLLERLSRFDDPVVSSWLTVLKARLLQKEKKLSQAHPILERHRELLGSSRPAAMFYLGMGYFESHENAAKANAQPGSSIDEDLSRGILAFLGIPALYGDQHAEMSAAALFYSAKISDLRKRNREAQKLRDELLKRYGQTYHGRLGANQTSTR
jgi:hypothetical protein